MQLRFIEKTGYSDCYINNDYVCTFDSINISPSKLKNISIEEINIIFEQLKQIGDGMICFNYANAKKYNLK